MTTINPEYWHYVLAKSRLRVANVLRCGQSKAMGDLNRARSAYHRSLYGAPERYEDAIPVAINGIPASFAVTSYRPPVDERVFGVHPDHAMPGDPGEVEGVICDRRGYPAPWLAEMVDADDLDGQLFDWMRRMGKVE